MNRFISTLIILIVILFAGAAFSADAVPPVIDLPGTQPKEVGTFESPNRCDNCHGGYDETTYPGEPAFGWRGSAMGNAGRDPIFWATLAVAEQDFDGVGDLCIRCHSAAGWVAGRSTPTDGSGLQTADDDGIDCDTCHLSTNPDDSEHQGVMFEPFVTNTPDTGAEGFYGSGMISIWGGNEKLGPYTAADAKAKHQRMQSAFHRSEDFCGTCHDVSNSVTGHFAPNYGAQPGAVGNVITPANNPDGLTLRVHLEPDSIFGTNQSYVGLNNPPYAYGIVERTFSEYKSSAFSGMPISKFFDTVDPLPDDLKTAGGALARAANAAGSTYEDGTDRYFTCQSCHMAPLSVSGLGCNKQGVPSRPDLPVHDLTGGNNWIYPLIKYQDLRGTLRMGGGLNETQTTAMDAGIIRAEDSLRSTISMEVTADDKLRLTNLTGHKAITGYPEGRRMWLNIKWYNGSTLLREDGEYGPLPGVSFDYTASDGTHNTFTPESLLDLHDPNTRIYEAHYAITQEWAATLVTVDGLKGTSFGSIVLDYDRTTGAPAETDGQIHTIAWLAAQPAGTYHETFHFALNNHVAKDNRIPPYRMNYEKAKKRNALPVPEYQYGGDKTTQTPPSTYNHWDEYDLGAVAAAIGATSADITLYYQGTSWEYVQFLYLANKTPAGQFLADEGVNMLDAWVNALDKNNKTMVPPFAMATATWGTSVCVPTGVSEAICNGVDDNCDNNIDEDWTSTATSCGVGACSAAGTTTCVDGVEGDTCTPGTPGTEGPDGDNTCSDEADNDCDGLTDAADPDCNPQLCDNDGVCEPGEDCQNCASDCKGKQGGKPSNRYCCGDGTLQSAEGDGTICDGNF